MFDAHLHKDIFLFWNLLRNLEIVTLAISSCYIFPYLRVQPKIYPKELSSSPQPNILHIDPFLDFSTILYYKEV